MAGYSSPQYCNLILLKKLWVRKEVHHCNLAACGWSSQLRALSQCWQSWQTWDWLAPHAHSLSSRHFHFEYRRVWWLLTGSFCCSPRLGDGFTDFVPWSMGCNYIFTIGSPSYNVQRMLTICFNTSPAGRYSSWLLSVPIFIDIFLSRPEPWGSVQTWAPLKGYFDRNHFSSELRERAQWMICPGLACGGGELSWWWENDKTRGNLESQRQGRGPLDAVTPVPWILQYLGIIVPTLSCDH